MAFNLCRQTITPLAWCDSPSFVKVIHQEILDDSENDVDQPEHHLQAARVRIITDFFYESIRNLVSENI